jgi:hypothetical protein
MGIGLIWRQILLVVATAGCALGEDIDGVQPAALDQPRINLVVRRAAGGQPLTAQGGTFNVEAFLDTGAGSIDFSAHTAEQLGIGREMAGKSEARFEDVGVGGATAFAVSEPIFISMAPEAPNVDVDQKDAIAMTYGQTVGPVRAEIGPLSSGMDFLTELAVGDLDVAGMPVMRGKIVVMDPRDVNAETDKIRTYLYDDKSAGKNTGIPKTSEHVRLTYVSFAGFTKVSPAGAKGPEIGWNPMIGPNPFSNSDHTPGVGWIHGGKSGSGTWLLDTGSAVSMISVKKAAELGVTYVLGTEGTGHPKLAAAAGQRQFIMTVGGIGGSKKSAGFFLDRLSIPTMEGKAIVFDHAPVLVADITVTDAQGRVFTLDGVLGMNFLVASAMVDEGAAIPDIGQINAGAFKWIVINHADGWLGVERN